MTIFVTWQLRVTLDSIRNSCDVYIDPSLFQDIGKIQLIKVDKEECGEAKVKEAGTAA